MSYYVIETRYVGANADGVINSHRVAISETPARGNAGDRPVVVTGWCGTTNDWSEYAHGSFGTLEDARDYVCVRWPEFREVDADRGEVSRYLIGLERMTADYTREWVWDDAKRRVTATTTDEEIDRLVDEWATQAEHEAGDEAQGMALDERAARALCRELREDLA